MTNIPIGNPGRASDAYESFRQDHLILSDTPTFFTTDETVADLQDFELYEVVGMNEDGQIVPATWQGLNATYASGALTFSGLAIADETVVIDGVTYTFKAAPSAAYEVLIGADNVECAANLVLAINQAPVTVGSEEYFETGTDEHPSVIALDAGGGVVNVRAKVSGRQGNVATTETLTNGAWGGATLAGGTGAVQAMGITAGKIATSGATAITQIIRGGHFNGDMLVWDASFDDDSKKIAAFNGAPTPTQIVIGFNKYNRKPTS